MYKDRGKKTHLRGRREAERAAHRYAKGLLLRVLCADELAHNQREQNTFTKKECSKTRSAQRCAGSPPQSALCG